MEDKNIAARNAGEGQYASMENEKADAKIAVEVNFASMEDVDMYARTASENLHVSVELEYARAAMDGIYARDGKHMKHKHAEKKLDVRFTYALFVSFSTQWTNLFSSFLWSPLC